MSVRFSKEDDRKLRECIEENKDAALAFWRDLVNHEGQHGEKEMLLKTAGFLKDSLEAWGLTVELLDAGERNAPVVTAVLNPEAPGKPIVFSGHYDTVFAAGSRGKDPFDVRDGKVYGPGCCDMKGGVTMACFVVRMLQMLEFKDCPVRLFFLGDEEVNHYGGTGIELIQEYTADVLAVFNMENRRESGEICVGRKGNYEYKAITYGVGAHPGNAYDSGRNAILEMAHRIIALQAVTPPDPDRDYSVSVDVISGGTVTNVVPNRCEVKIDVRIRSMAALEECERKMREAVAVNTVPDTRTELILVDPMPPFETTPQVMETYETVQKISDAVGSDITGHVTVGGASDAAHMLPGTKVLCQCGVKGAMTHNIGEYALLDSLYEGIRLFTHVVLNYEMFR